MKSGKLLFLFAVAVALFAVLQIAKSSKESIDDEAKSIRKHVDEEFKKMSKRAADEDDDGGKHKKGKKRKGGSTTTAAPGDKSTTTAAPGGSTTTKAPGGGTTTTTAKAADGSTTKAPSGSSTKAPGTGHPDAPTTTTGKPGDSTKSDMKPAIEKQEAERELIRNAFKELVKWQEWLHTNNKKTLNPKAAKATWQMAERIKRIIESNTAGKPRRFHGKLDTTW